MKKYVVLYLQMWMLLVSAALNAQLTKEPAPSQPAMTKEAAEKNKLSGWGCGTEILMKQELAKNPNAFSTNNSKYSTGHTNTNPPPPTSPYIIPVVFHIIKDANPLNATPIPTYKQIQWQLASLNAAFSNNIAMLNNVPAGAHASDVKVQFCLAKNYQTGSGPVAWPTASLGVMTYTTNNTNLISNVVMNNPSSLSALVALTNSSNQFPFNMYLNIWCVPNITNQTSYSIFDAPSIIGFAAFPGSTGPMDGIVMRNDCIGNNSYNNNFNMFNLLDKGNILAHEAGHYLGLLHTFETVTGGNIGTAGGPVGCYGMANLPSAQNDGDAVSDTPPSQINFMATPGVYNTCFESYMPYGLAPDEPDQLENFMSYSDDELMNTFTFYQGERMWASLDGAYTAPFVNAQRSNLWTNTNLTATGVNSSPSCGPGLLTSAFTSSLVFSSITCTSMAVQFNVPALPNYIVSPTYYWQFGDGGTSTSANPVHTYLMPPTQYTVTLTVTSGASNSTSSQVVQLINNNVMIVGQSGANFPVCRGTEQTVLVQFPANANSAILTDGTNFYPFNSNFTHTCTSPAGVYIYPFRIVVNSNITLSLLTAGCGTNNAASASFSVIDCCNNLVTNGDFESGNTGFYSGYTLNTYNTGGGKAAINFPGLTDFPSMANTAGLTGKTLIVDSKTNYSGCGNIGQKKLIAGQGITGLKPNTKYYLAYKVGQSWDSIPPLCANKFNLRLFDSGNNNLFNKNMVTTTVPTGTCRTGGGGGAMQVMNFTLQTSGAVQPNLTYSLELSEMENSFQSGFDYQFDNIILREMNPAININPLVSAICPGGNVQINTSNNCVNIANYSLIWQPSTGLSCNTCPNPMASPAITTVYTLIAIPPITVPPSQNIIITTTVFVVPTTPTLSVASPTPFCASGAFTLTASGVPTVTWQPGGQVGNVVVVNPTGPTTYTATYTNGMCTSTGTIAITNVPGPGPNLTVINPSSPCYPATYTIVATGATSTLTWQPGGATGNTVVVTPTTITTYSAYYNYPCRSVVTITPPAAPPAISVTVPSGTICAPSLMTYTLSVNGVPTGTWYPGGTTGVTVAVTPNTLTTYTFNYLLSNGCLLTSTVSLGPPQAPTLSIINPTLLCAPANFTLTATGVPSRTWIPGGSTSTAIVVSPTIITTYTVLYGAGCSAVITVTPPQTTPTLTATMPSVYGCYPSLINYTLTAIGVPTATWYPGATVGTTVLVTPTAITTYTAIYAPSPSCPVSQTISVFPPQPPPVLTLITPTTPVCYPNTTSFTLTAAGVPTIVWQPSGSNNFTLVVTPPSTAPVTYTASFYGPGACVSSSAITVSQPPPLNLTATGAGTYCTNNVSPYTATAAFSPTIALPATYTWFPGGATGPTPTLNPTANTQYTVIATVMGCTASAIIGVEVYTMCCPQNYPLFTGTLVTGGGFSGSNIVLNDIIVNGPSWTSSYFNGGEFLMGPNVKITVKPGNEMYIMNSHFYACGNQMWKGIIVEDGAKLDAGANSLIEDAITAIDLSNITPGHVPDPLEIIGTTFNKNYVSINIANSTGINNLHILLYSNVFTSRNIPFTSTWWPDAGTSPTGLRFASLPTSGILTPYLLFGYQISNLKIPYTNQSAETGIQINNIDNVQGNSPGAGIEFGNQNNMPDYNLFDALGFGIDITDAGLTTYNNVFQNMQRFSTVNGTAIRQNITSLMNAGLFLSPPVFNYNSNFGNRFWHNYKAIEATNLYVFDADYLVCRSRQNSMNLTPASFLPGNTGVEITTNRFRFNIREGDFNNIQDAIKININSGPYDIGGYNTGTYADNLHITHNYFGIEVNSSMPVPLTNAEYMCSAVTVNYPNNGAQTYAGGNLAINSNKVDRAFRGLSVDGLDMFPTDISGNDINLRDDLLGQPQYGIQINNTLDNVASGWNTIRATGITNTKISGYYCDNNQGNNPPGSPYITCNTLQDSYKGFEFIGNNKTTLWMGNTMQNHYYGLYLSTNGVIGTQGGMNNPSDNQWLGPASFWASPPWQTYADGSSSAANSILYVQGGPTYNPFSNGSVITGNDYGSGYLSITGGFGNYSCPAATVQTAPNYRIAGLSNVDKNKDWSVEMYPNPSSGKLNIRSSKENDHLRVKIMDVNSKMIFSDSISTVESVGTLDLNLAAGVYFIMIKNDNNQEIHKKLIITK